MYRLTVLVLVLAAFCGALPASADERLENISTRGQVLTGDGVLIAGFVISGSTDKTVMIRARGPSLTDFGVPGALSDPQISLLQVDGTPITSNDDWADDPRASEIPPSLALTNAKDSALVVTLSPGNYTPIVSGVGGATGIAIVEVFELDTMARLENIATRGFVGTGDNVMIGGFIVSAATSQSWWSCARGAEASLRLASTPCSPIPSYS